MCLCDYGDRRSVLGIILDHLPAFFTEVQSLSQIQTSPGWLVRVSLVWGPLPSETETVGKLPPRHPPHTWVLEKLTSGQCFPAILFDFLKCALSSLSSHLLEWIGGAHPELARDFKAQPATGFPKLKVLKMVLQVNTVWKTGLCIHGERTEETQKHILKNVTSYKTRAEVQILRV